MSSILVIILTLLSIAISVIMLMDTNYQIKKQTAITTNKRTTHSEKAIVTDILYDNGDYLVTFISNTFRELRVESHIIYANAEVNDVWVLDLTMEDNAIVALGLRPNNGVFFQLDTTVVTAIFNKTTLEEKLCTENKSLS